MTRTISNIRYHWFHEPIPDMYEKWTNRLGVAVFGSVSAWLVVEITIMFFKLA